MYQKHLDTLVAAWNVGNLDALAEISSPNLVRKAPNAVGAIVNNFAELRSLITDFRIAFPDTKVTLTETYFLDNSSVCKWHFHGTNTGPGEFPTTGRSVDIDGMSIQKYENNKLVREEVYFDALEMLSQLGIIEIPKAATA